MNASDISTERLISFRDDNYYLGKGERSALVDAELSRRQAKVEGQEVRYLHSKDWCEYRKLQASNGWWVVEQIIHGELTPQHRIWEGSFADWNEITASEYAEAKAKAGKVEPACEGSPWCAVCGSYHPKGMRCGTVEAAPEEKAIEPCSPCEPIDALPSVFQKELEQLINSHSMENNSDTPDFILAEYLMGCLSAWKVATRARDKWYGYSPWSGGEVNRLTAGKE